jgi:hypothetical protein
MSVVLRKYVPLLILGVSGFLVIFAFPLNLGVLSSVTTDLGNWVSILASFALGIGAINLFIVHGKPIMRREKGQWIYSVALLSTLIIVFLVGSVYGVKGSEYVFLYGTLIGAGLLTLTSLRAFFMFTAFGRAYKVKTLPGIIMLITSIMVMMWQVPLFEQIYLPLSDFTKWMLDTPYVGVTRAILMLSGLGLVVMVFKLISGMDKSWMGREE